MSALETDLNITPAIDAGLQAIPGEDLGWITENIDTPAAGEPAPLPTAADAGADKGAVMAEDKTLVPDVEKVAATGEEAVEEKPVVVDELKPEAKVEAKAETETDDELSEEDSKLVESLPVEQQAQVAPRFKRAFFMNHYMNPDKKMTDIVDHLSHKSGSRFGEMEGVILERNLANPADFALKTFKSSPETYTKLVGEFYRGDPKFFAQTMSGREDYVDPKQVQTAVEFYEAHKDAKFETSTKLSELDEETLAEIEHYHGPDKAAAVREALEIAQKAKAAEATEETPAQPAADPAKAVEAEVERRSAAEKENFAIWNAGRDVIENHAISRAYNPQTGIGIAVTAEERATAPLVARLKDFKAEVFFQGLTVEGKPILPGFEDGINKWGEGRPAYMEKILHMDTFAKAREKANVLEVANSAKPLADSYYDDRLKHPIFKEIDDIIAIVAAQGKTEPKLDPQIPGALPSPKGSNAATGDGDWLVNDAVTRVAGQ